MQVDNLVADIDILVGSAMGHILDQTILDNPVVNNHILLVVDVTIQEGTVAAIQREVAVVPVGTVAAIQQEVAVVQKKAGKLREPKTLD